ncbi:MAG TPA: hypothetical protein GX708_24965 [Gallicola sp.]|nr:hypothetical protein [Gallicola sp.]
MNELIRKLGDKVKEKDMTWQEVADKVNQEYDTELTREAVRKRYNRIIKNKNKPIEVNKQGEYETLYGDGTVEAQKIVNLSPSEKASPDLVLKKLGYNPNEWELVMMSFSNWQQHTKEQSTKELYAVKFRIKPRLKEITTTDYLEAAKKVFAEEIKPIKLDKKEVKKELDNELMIECPAIELHLGKLAHYMETGENYDHKIAQDRFKQIMSEIVVTQEVTKSGTLFMGIGNDFFNTDTVTYATTKGTPQNNDLRWQKMFLVGLKLYTESLLELRKHFNKVDINLTMGNHDTMNSFYLFIALQQYFKDDNVINFIEDYKRTQCYKFGKCAIFTNHGESNLKRLTKSIPAEFYEEWGSSIYRELHLGHLHKEVVVDDESGLITRRVGSPSGTDDWHYSERFIGATARHQLFLWHKEQGLLMSRYITFSKKKLNNEKVLIKR